MKSDEAAKLPPLWIALLPVAALIAFLVVQIRLFDGSAHLPLILASIVAALAGWSRGSPGRRWSGG